MKKIICVLMFSILFAGCSKVEKVQTVDWYKKHNDERQQVMKKCNNDPGNLEDDKNCINAFAADDSIVWGSKKFINPPVIKFQPK